MESCKTANGINKEEALAQNYKIVESLARSYRPFLKTLTLEDIEIAGALGLLNAVESYDENGGCSLSTYIYNKVRFAIVDEIRNHDSLVRIPNFMYKYVTEFLKEHKESGVSLDEFAKDRGVSPVVLRQAVNAYKTPVYLDEPIIHSEDDLAFVMETLTSDEDVEGAVLCKEVKEKVQDLLNACEDVCLSKRQAAIFRHYFGIGAEEKTLKEFGEMHNLSTERIRQIVKSTSRKLRTVFHNQENLLETCDQYNIAEMEL